MIYGFRDSDPLAVNQSDDPRTAPVQPVDAVKRLQRSVFSSPVRLSEIEMDQNDYDKDDICSEEELDDNFDYTDYYSTNEFDFDSAQLINKDKEDDPEYFEYNCLTFEQTLDYINQLVDEICNHIQVSYSVAKVSASVDRLALSLSLTKIALLPAGITVFERMERQRSD